MWVAVIYSVEDDTTDVVGLFATREEADAFEKAETTRIEEAGDELISVKTVAVISPTEYERM